MEDSRLDRVAFRDSFNMAALSIAILPNSNRLHPILERLQWEIESPSSSSVYFSFQSPSDDFSRQPTAFIDLTNLPTNEMATCPPLKSCQTSFDSSTGAKTWLAVSVDAFLSLKG